MPYPTHPGFRFAVVVATGWVIGIVVDGTQSGRRWQAFHIVGSSGTYSLEAVQTMSSMSSMVSPILSCGTAGMLPWTQRPECGVSWRRVATTPKGSVERISVWKYVDMTEMLPEFCAVLKGEDDSKKAVARHPKHVTDFHTWLQCFCTV